MFISLSPEETDTGINFALKTIGEFSKSDRAYIFIFSENSEKMVNTHEWCAPGITPQIDNLKGILSEFLPWWMKKLRKGENIYIPLVADLPVEASTEKILLEDKIYCL